MSNNLASPALIEQAIKAKKIRIELARRDFRAFVRYVVRDEESGNPVTLSPTHEKWAKLFDSGVKRLVLWSHVEAAKSSFITIARTLFEIGQNPNIRIAIVSNTADQAGKFLSSIAKYIAESDEYHEVFPEVQKSEPWTTSKIQVARNSVLKDPTVQAYGEGGAVTGARLDLLILDDVLDFENCRTAGGRDKLYKWYKSALAGRLTTNSRVYCVGTAYHPDDIMHRFAREGAWEAHKFPVIDKKGNLAWPSRWPIERIEQRKLELGPLEFARQMMCEARNETDSRCKMEWIKMCLDRGDGWKLIPALPPPGLGVSGLYDGLDIVKIPKDLLKRRR